MSARAASARVDSALRLVLADRFYRSATIALFIYGVAMSATVPQMTLFLAKELGASLQVAGSYFLVNLIAPLAGFVIGAISDRRSDRLVVFRICAVVCGAGWLAMALSTQLWMPFVIGAGVLSLGGAIIAQLLAAVRDQLSHHPTAAENRIISMVRMGFCAGWVIGPVLGTWIGTSFGPRVLFLFTAVCAWAQLVPIGRQKVYRFIAAPLSETAASPRGGMSSLLIFTGLCVFLMSGDTIKFAYVPIYMTEQLRSSALTLGLVIAVQPLLEIAVMPVAARLSDRFGTLPILIIGGVFGVAAYLTYAASSSATGMFAGQVLTAVLWGCLASLGVTIAQQLHPGGVATASGLFTGAIMLAAAAGGAIGGFGVTVLGLPGVFVIPAAFTAAAVVGLTLQWCRPAVRAAVSPPSTQTAMIAEACCGDR